ncbi:hypothetical protein A2U01_0082124, partial [Trifolium medium]|nr:hypothetical protein [Trifolium medium]
MMPVVKGWAKWLVRNFERCSNETDYYVSVPRHLCYHEREPIQI